MTFTRVLANATVSDLAAAEAWYTSFFGRGPDARPMDGLLEWELEAGGVQVWAEPDRAGRSTVVVEDSDLDAAAGRLADAGLVNDGPEPATAFRIIRLEDPDGNRIVVVGS